jgi:hypothetical protein
MSVWQDTRIGCGEQSLRKSRFHFRHAEDAFHTPLPGTSTGVEINWARVALGKSTFAFMNSSYFIRSDSLLFEFIVPFFSLARTGLLP